MKSLVIIVIRKMKCRNTHGFVGIPIQYLSLITLLLINPTPMYLNCGMITILIKIITCAIVSRSQ